MTALGLIIVCGLLSIAYAVWATRSVLSADAGSARMQEISAAVREGAQAYLKRQYTTIGIVGIVIFLIVGYFLGWLVGIGFAIGAILSGAAGFIGMNVSVRANVRTAQAAISSLGAGLELAFKSGAITGMLVAGLALLGVSIYFAFLTGPMHFAVDDRTVIDSMVALGFGASLISIFARLGGGIFTKRRRRRRRFGRQRSRPGIPRMIRATRPPSPTTLATTPRLRRHGGRPVRDLRGNETVATMVLAAIFFRGTDGYAQ
jgi:K(+)-stimulated pyrophosphate-energized sodium pump